MQISFGEPYLRIDVSDEPLEVANYLFDQFPDRWDGYYDDSLEIEINREEKFIEFALPSLNLIFQIIEEKKHDLAYEAKHSEL